MRQVRLPLGQPPRVVNAGVGIHGVKSQREVFQLPDLWQFHLYAYVGELTVDGTVHPIRPGHVSLVPPHTEVRYDYRGRSEHLYAHLSLSGEGEAHGVPVMQDAGAEAPLLSVLLHRAVAALPATPVRAAAEVWTALCHVADLPEPNQDGQGHRAVAAAMTYIEEHLAAPLTVPAVAQAAGLSHSHLTRLFHVETGGTVVAYIRRRRMERARHLLQASTLAIPAIAAAVGMPDLQAFNKTCRRELGRSPRAVRAEGSA
ncbi:AraC family transcriptional regulator [Streptomyces sp. NBC_01589]|uniref:AraC family transcriptional regulator n=1 Tax=Streptomyces sp. NBC_01589 TaxID=2975886 RepID=UPI0038672999